MNRRSLALLAALSITAVVHGQTLAIESLDASGVARGGYYPRLSADGRYVAFTSDASDLVPNDTNGLADVFLRDRWLGTIERVNLADGGSQSQGLNYSDFFAGLSADGRFVLFGSDAPNLVVGDTNGLMDGFLRDRQLGTTERVSVSTSGAQVASCSFAQGVYAVGMSDDARYVLLTSDCSDLDPADSNGGWYDTFLRDRLLGTTQLVSRATSGVQGNRHTTGLGITPDGSRVLLWSMSSNLVPDDTNGSPDVYAGQDIFVRDLVLGVTTRVSVGTSGTQSNGASGTGSFSADGRRIVFVSLATNLVVGDTNGRNDVFLHDLATSVTERVSVSSEGAEGDWLANDGFAEGAGISRDGRWAIFPSYSTNLVPGDTNGLLDVFTRDLDTGTTSRVSLGSGLTQIADSIYSSSMSADGRFVAFHCQVSLLPADANALADVYLLDRGAVGPHAVFCEGSAASCPCANASVGYPGCANSTGVGALLGASGVPSVAADTITLSIDGMPATAPGLYFQGTTRIANGTGAAFGDGLRCVGGSVLRLGSRVASGGTSAFGFGIGGDPLVSAAGSLPPAGATRHYQVWYRNIAPFCTSDGFNLTNGITLAWRP